MKKIKLFFLWQDAKEEAWLNQQSRQGFNLTAVKFPFTYFFSEGSGEEFIYHLNAPIETAAGCDSFLESFRSSGWEQIAKKNGWHYFQLRRSEKSTPEIEWGNEIKAAKFQKYMMALVGLLPFLLIIFPAIGRRIPQPFYGGLKMVYFAFLAVYTIITYQVYRRVNQLRD
jgi:hypothetical protein